MKRFTAVCVTLVLAAGCTEDRNSYNSIEFQDSKGSGGMMRSVSIDDTRSTFQPRPVYHGNATDDGMLYDTFSIAGPGIYTFNLMLSGTYIYLRPGDATKVSISGDVMTPTYQFEGDGADINRFFAANEQITTAALGPITEGKLERMSETDIAAVVTRIRDGEQQLLKQSGSDLTDSLREFVRIENDSRVATFCMFYRYKLNKLAQNRIPTPVIDGLLRNFNPNEPEAFAISPSYRTAVYEFHKAAFQATDGGSNRLRDFSAYISNNAIAVPIGEYLLAKFAANYCLTEYANPDSVKADYDYLISVLSDPECRTQVYQNYVKATRKAR